MKLLPILGVILFLTGAHADTPNEAPLAKTAKISVQLDSADWRDVPLLADVTEQWLLAEALIGDRKALFLVDTGAETTVIDRAVAKEWGLTIKKETKSKSGIGGESTWGYSSVPEFEIAGIKLPGLEVGVNDMEVVTKQGFWGEHRVSGILGVDLLTRIKAVLDVSGHRLLLPKNDVKFFSSARINGLKALPFVDSKLSIVDGKISGSPVRVLSDTGARILAVDSALAAKVKLPAFRSKKQVSGVGGNQQVTELFVQSLEFDGCRCVNAGGYGTELGVLQGRAGVITGMDFLVPARAIFDFAGQQIYLREGAIDAHERGLGGPILGTKEQIAAKVAACRRVALVQILGIAAGAQLKDSNGAVLRKFTFRCKIDELLAGEGAKGDVVDVPVAVPLAAADQDALIEKAKNRVFRLLLQTDQMKALDATLMRDNQIRRVQIEGVKKKK